ncbi:hypothetical protein OIU77_022916 [Salix suchowensis]|uniref:Uncharacterized protein n=1 Tax=Salix suchowensis TaxID=1278906 RepID=A0ABQ9C201_9ROSI|nr:hypothetical protein OIU77_022916 [Salix suchowensis]
MEELIRSKNQVADQLREEGEKMYARIFDPEGNLLDIGDSFSPCLKELKEESMKQNERLGPDARQTQFQMENEIHNLASKIEEQQKILKEKEDTIKKLAEETKAVRHHLLDSSNHRPLDSPKYRPLESP